MKDKLLLLPIVCLSFVLFGHPNLSSEASHRIVDSGNNQSVSLRGVVTFATGELVRDATITLGNDKFYKQVHSDEKGNYSFSNIPSGTYNLLATGWIANKAGLFIKKDIEIKDNATALVINIVLSPPAKQKA